MPFAFPIQGGDRDAARPAGTDGEHAARPDGHFLARHRVDANDYGLDRIAARRSARYRKYMVGLLVFLGCSGPFGACLRRRRRSAPLSRPSIRRVKCSSIRRIEDGARRAAQGHGYGILVFSLLGLAGSLILGFLELQANHAHNRFYNELEEWLSGITELTPAHRRPPIRRAGSSRPPFMKCSVPSRNLLTNSARYRSRTPRRPAFVCFRGPGGRGRQGFGTGVNQLVTLMRSEQKVVREWVDEQASQQAELAGALKALADTYQRRTT